MWLDQSLHWPRDAFATRNDATYPEGRTRIQWGTGEWAYRGWQLYNQENHPERSLQINIYFSWSKTRSELNYTWGHIKHLQGLPWFGEYRQDTSPVLHLARCSLFHRFVIHKAFSASWTITFGLHSSEGCESCFSAMSTTNPRYPRVSCIRLEIDFSALARNAFCVVSTRSFCCRSAKVADTRCAACGTRWGSGSVF